MRVFLGTLMLSLLPATAVGQFIDQPDNAAGEAPPPAQAGDERGPGARGMFGPPNVMFSAIDADSDGKITARELRRAAVQLKKLDVDKDGNITLAEVSPRGGPGGPAGPGGGPAQMIDEIMQNDKNNDGKLSAREIPNELKPMLEGADQNNDRAIDRAELTAAMETMRNQFPGGRGWRGGPGGPNDAFDPGRMTGQFMQLDQNGDQRLSPNEIPPNMQGVFQPTDDLDNDGSINAAELQAITRRMGERARAFAPGAGNQRNDPGAPTRNGRGRERPQRNEN
jgi:Ca2+-binding EF-hand superfamily protein